MDFFRHIEGRLIVSCQSSPGDAFYGPECMARFACAAVKGGAAAIRANGPEDVAAIRAAVDVPVLAIQKRQMPDGRILITPSIEHARALVAAGAAAVALDCTARGRRYGALETLRQIRELGVVAAADIATVEEALEAVAAGADCVLSTLRGYTEDTAEVRAFSAAFLRDLVRAVSVPVIAEGRIWTADEARAAMHAGAFAVVVGSAITRPHEIAARLSSAVRGNRGCWFAGLDIGGTNIKFGLVSGRGELREAGATATPAHAGREAMLACISAVVAQCVRRAGSMGMTLAGVGIATGGWVDPQAGRIIYATGNIPGWTGAGLGPAVAESCGLPVVVENDGNAFAVAERRFGDGAGVDDFVGITLGTGVGGGCYVNGRLSRGAWSLGNGIGHICVDPAGQRCTCGQRGCLETFANAAALVRYAGGAFGSAREVIAAANAGDVRAEQAIGILAGRLAAGCAAVIHMLDPAMLIFGGGLAQENPLLLARLAEELAGRVYGWSARRIALRASRLGYHAGVLGAAAVAMN